MKTTRSLSVELVDEEAETTIRRREGPLRVISIKIDPLLLQKVDELARQCKMTRSELIRTAIECLLSEIIS